MSKEVPCPFCGDTEALHVRCDDPQDDDSLQYVECKGCGARGPSTKHPSAMKAIELWERRAHNGNGDRNA